MPLQNRVLPTGDIVSDPARGTMTGNRGILHGPDREMTKRRWSHHAWICCTLDWQGRRRKVMTGRKWTELFFLDEAVAFAAGHRPCAYCRRADYNRFTDAWAAAFGSKIRAPEVDKILHQARIEGSSRHQKHHICQADDLPNGSFVMHDGVPHVVHDDALVRYAPQGYGNKQTRPNGSIKVITPAPFLDVFKAGYKPDLHSSLST